MNKMEQFEKLVESVVGPLEAFDSNDLVTETTEEEFGFPNSSVTLACRTWPAAE